MDDDYDIMPHKDIIALKKEVEALKKGPGSQDTTEELLHSMNKMLGIFNTAVEELKLEEKEENFASKKIDPMLEKLDKVIDQNKQIAEAIVAIVDMIKERTAEEIKPLQPSYPKPEPKPMQFEPLPQMPPPMMETRQTKPSQFHPPPMQFPDFPPKQMNIPSPMPEAPLAPKKKGLFGL